MMDWETWQLRTVHTQCVRVQVYKTLVALTDKLSSWEDLQPSPWAAFPLRQNQGRKLRHLKAAPPTGAQLQEKVLWIWSQNLTWLPLTPPLSSGDLISDLISNLLPHHPSLSNTWSQIQQILPPFLLASFSFSGQTAWNPTTVFSGMFLRPPPP